MNEITQINAEDFRLKKISDLQTKLKNEADHFRQVAKKYKRTHNITHISAVGLGSLSAGLSSATLETALTGFGIVASPALAGVATVFGLLSAGFAVVSKNLEKKVNKHEKNLHTGPGQTKLCCRAGFEGTHRQENQRFRILNHSS